MKLETFKTSKRRKEISDRTFTIGMWILVVVISLLGTWQTAYDMAAEAKAEQMRPLIAHQVYTAEAALTSEARQIETVTEYMNRSAEQSAAIATLQEDNAELAKKLRARWISQQPKKTYTASKVTTGGSGWKVAEASWYGPGLYGNTMARGGILTRSTMGVAHKSLPIGTRVMFRNPRNGRTVTVSVRDRGPYTAGRMWDLCPGTAAALDMFYTGTVQYKVL